MRRLYESGNVRFMEGAITYVALGAAMIGVLVSIVYIALLAVGIGALKKTRDRLNGGS